VRNKSTVLRSAAAVGKGRYIHTTRVHGPLSRPVNTAREHADTGSVYWP